MSILLAKEFCTEISCFTPEKETSNKLYILNYDNIIIKLTLFIINR